MAFSTSLPELFVAIIVPELATSVDSVPKVHLDLALGNIVGSCFINIMHACISTRDHDYAHRSNLFIRYNVILEI